MEFDGIADPAWAAVVDLERQAGQRLFGYATHLGVDHALAADMVQESLLRSWRELGRGVVITSAEAWAFRTLSRLVMDQHRLHRRVARLLSRLGDRPASRSMEADADQRVVIWAQVDRLPLRQRQVVYLRYRADLSYEEIGRVLGITPGAARTHATAAMASLRERLGPWEGDR